MGSRFAKSDQKTRAYFTFEHQVHACEQQERQIVAKKRRAGDWKKAGSISAFRR
ncbi:hypothetical protein [Liquorilactobacillus oeni]|uniref:Uncharacterized protein n=1 Tax=Liquorilactobacillus oeni DSM 19972 TaxID=1423777 RepID=A0A0R1MJG5_9LACO|nr:hypothetical protein [Liquorilactobacillus oeni]KRL04008.1 hypothetical protein FD46_GL000010 [Liquorilactobacillus oeni DSM 19972]